MYFSNTLFYSSFSVFLLYIKLLLSVSAVLIVLFSVYGVLNVPNVYYLSCCLFEIMGFVILEGSEICLKTSFLSEEYFSFYANKNISRGVWESSKKKSLKVCHLFLIYYSGSFIIGSNFMKKSQKASFISLRSF